jgi:hypothetical protein
MSNDIELNPIFSYNDDGNDHINERITESAPSLLLSQLDPYLFTKLSLLINLKNDYIDIYNKFLISLIIQPEVNLKESYHMALIYYMGMFFYYYTRISVICMIGLNILFLVVNFDKYIMSKPSNCSSVLSFSLELTLNVLSTLPIFLRTCSKYYKSYLFDYL